MRRPYTHCEWLIAPGYAPIGLTFTRFSLAASDMLFVYDGETADPTRLLGVYTGMAPLDVNYLRSCMTFVMHCDGL